MVKLTAIIICSIAAGIFGRMGGAGRPFRTWQRDWIVPLFFICLVIWLNNNILYSFRSIIAYIVAYLALAGSLTTYWDNLFHYDNLLFSGLIAGLSATPLSLVNIRINGILMRAGILAIIWWLLNKRLPARMKRILIWRRDVVEEFLRYAAVIATIPLLFKR